MTARRRRRSKKWLFWLLFLILVIVAGVVIYLVWDNYFKGVEEVEDKKEEVILVEEEEKQEEKEEKEQEVAEKPEVVQYEGEDPNAHEELTGVVTYAGVVGEKLMIRVNINQYLSGGNCVLRLLLDGDVTMYSDTVSMINSASTSTCEGFDVPVSELVSGKYMIIVGLNADGKTGVITGEVSL